MNCLKSYLKVAFPEKNKKMREGLKSTEGFSTINLNRERDIDLGGVQ